MGVNILVRTADAAQADQVLRAIDHLHVEATVVAEPVSVESTAAPSSDVLDAILSLKGIWTDDHPTADELRRSLWR
jgi:hypothetical protein